jgi:hypothetical protein
MKISALTGPMGAKDNPNVELQVERNGIWESLGEAPLDRDAWVATFRIPNWDESADTPYKLVYRERHSDNTETPDEWTGTIRANPVGRPLRMAALTCQNDYGFPYEPVANNVINMDPDIALFSGDQIYEGHGGFGIYREPAAPAILNYLRKYYQFGWAFRDAMRNQPTIVLPDDHDVFQGNIWGEGGAPMDTRDGGASSKGGYIQPARMVHAVHKTHVAHHPDAFDPTPIKQNISAYYGDMVYGGVSFAILADRMFKSGPEKVDTGSGRADHVTDRNSIVPSSISPGWISSAHGRKNSSLPGRRTGAGTPSKPCSRKPSSRASPPITADLINSSRATSIQARGPKRLGTAPWKFSSPPCRCTSTATNTSPPSCNTAPPPNATAVGRFALRPSQRVTHVGGDPTMKASLTSIAPNMVSPTPVSLSILSVIALMSMRSATRSSVKPPIATTRRTRKVAVLGS